MTKKCDYCVYRNTLECKKSPVPKDLICDDFMLDICALSNKEQIAIQKILIEEYRDTITRNQNFFDMAIEAPDKQDVSEINVGDMISRQRVSDLFDAWEAAELDHHIPKILRDRLKAIPSAQPEPQWIPVSERLPEMKKPILVTYETEDGLKVDKTMYDRFGFMIGEVTAWMPLPEPYSERRTDGN